MRLVQDDDVIETLPSDRANHALDVRVLPGTRRRGPHLGDAHTRHAALEGRAVDAVAIPVDPAGAVSSGKASTTCCAAHSAVRCAVRDVTAVEWTKRPSIMWRMNWATLASRCRIQAPLQISLQGAFTINSGNGVKYSSGVPLLRSRTMKRDP